MSDEVSRDDDISLLDIAVVIAESWVLLLLVPLIAAALTFAALRFLDDPSHTAQATLRLPQQAHTMLTTPEVLDPAIVTSAWSERHPGSLAQARHALARSLAINPVEPAGTYSITLTADSTELAVPTLEAVVTSLVEVSSVEQEDGIALEQRLEILNRSLSIQQSSLDSLIELSDRLTTAGSDQDLTAELNTVSQSIVAISNQIATTLAEAQPEAAVQPEIVEQPTVQVTDNTRQHILRAVLVGLGVGFILLIAVFVRSGLRSAAQDPVSLDKVNRIRRAFWLPPKRPETQS
ncbi:Wzz/FepE/Etk N-terminal domain-containing protein [Pelagibacterium sp.]|uniref:Wzz/FepE/Etk N-terminal domain-containing protein n=1 Tax=Pelagibacterium sp. TaxID=1967288 RepID=UPI003BA91676